MGWRTVDILTIAFLGAALGIAFWGWGVFYNGPLSAITFGFAPLGGLFAGPWFLAGVVGGLVVRRPGAALFCEVVAALVSMVPGTEWGATTLVSGIVQGLGTELAFALLGYRAFGIAAAMLAGALAGPFAASYESFTWIQDWSLAWKVAYAARARPLGCGRRRRRWLAAHPGPGGGGCAQRVPARPGAPRDPRCLSARSPTPTQPDRGRPRHPRGGDVAPVRSSRAGAARRLALPRARGSACSSSGRRGRASRRCCARSPGCSRPPTRVS